MLSQTEAREDSTDRNPTNSASSATLNSSPTVSTTFPAQLTDVGGNLQLTNRNLLTDVQRRIFYAIFYRLAMLYAYWTPKWLVRIHEFLFLLVALTSLVTLICMHIIVTRPNVQCIPISNEEISKSMILRVKLLQHGEAVAMPYFQHERDHLTEKLKMDQRDSSDVCLSQPSTCWSNKTTVPQTDRKLVIRTFHLLKAVNNYLFDGLHKSDSFILEFSYEYGLLRLSDNMRKHLHVKVLVIEIASTNRKCFGNRYWQLLLNEFIGHQEVLLSNIRRIFGKELKGYVRNVATGETFRFVATWVTKLSLLAGFTVMILFTLSISLLLRYCHNQIFFFIVELLQILDVNVIIVGSPVAPFITAILALIGIETIMSEFFNDSSIAFLVIVLIWFADQFYAVCCRTTISLKYWPRFFYLYQFVFYCYFVRYNGLFSGLALFSTYCFVIHSMVYFINHFELPSLITNTLTIRGSEEPSIYR